MAEFIPGAELSTRFYRAAVRPILEAEIPDLPHAAAHLGDGSDVAGFDTEMSMDHDWGPRCIVFLREEDSGRTDHLLAALERDLPVKFLGHPVRYLSSKTPAESPEHHVAVTTIRSFFRAVLSWEFDEPFEAVDWLTVSSQVLRSVTAGRVHHDGFGEITRLRDRLAWYPRNVWLYLLASGWRRIAQEEHLMPRAGFVGDETGSAVMGGRLARDIMRLVFFMERHYPPYPKWFGTAFRQLRNAGEFEPAIRTLLEAETWRKRQDALCDALTRLARLHNSLGCTESLPETTSFFFNRPFPVIWGDRFADAIVSRIDDPIVRAIADRRLIGSVDQWSDSTDILSYIHLRHALKHAYAIS